METENESATVIPLPPVAPPVAVEDHEALYAEAWSELRFTQGVHAGFSSVAKWVKMHPIQRKQINDKIKEIEKVCDKLNEECVRHSKAVV